MKKFILAIIACFSVSANAGLIEESNYVIDTDQGLDWLRWDETNNRSYNDVLSNLGAGGDFEGWQFATATQAELFLDGLGLTDYSTATQETTSDIFQELARLMGVEMTPTQSWIYGMVETSGTKARTYSQYDYSWRAAPEYKIFNLNKTYSAGFLGSFLVRETSYVAPGTPLVQPINLPVQVTEPATLMLLVLTLGGLLTFRKRRH